MNYSEVKELLSAGFTADEIRGMMAGNNPQFPQLSPQDENTNIPEKETEKSTENDKQAQGDQSANNPELAPGNKENTNIPNFDSLNENISKLIKTIQTANFQNASFDQITKTDLNTQVDNIMASIIRPEKEKGD